MKKVFLPIVMLLIPLFSFGQILNLDRTIEVDSAQMSKKKYAAVLGASFSSVQQVYSFIDGSLTYDFTHYMPKKHILVLSGRGSLTSNGTQVIQNSGFSHLRYRDNDTRRFSPEPFTQYQWNATLGLVHRYLLGCNLRVQLYNKTSADIYYGLGAMYENEQWNYHGVTEPLLIPYYWNIITNKFYKSNQYIKASITISSSCDVVTAVFLQNKIDDFANSYRLSNYLTFNLRVSRKIYFALSSDISYDNKPVVPIKNTLYSLTSTLSVRL